MQLILMRHGEPTDQARGRCYSRADIGLSAAGRSQIESKLHSIASFNAVALYSSPAKRALESAEMVSAFLGLEVKIAPELQEIDFGDFEGLTYEEIETRYPQEFRLWMEKPTEVKFPRGESFAEMKERVLKFKDSLLDRGPQSAPVLRGLGWLEAHRGRTIILVSHAGTNRILLAEALRISDPLIFRIDQVYAALNVIDYSQAVPIVKLING